MTLWQLRARRGVCVSLPLWQVLCCAAFCLAISLGLSGQALAQTDTAEADAAVAADDWVYIEYDWANCGLALPPGGRYPDPAEVGLNDPTDPMVYPLVWISDGMAGFDSMILGVAAQDFFFDENSFTDLLGSFHGWLLIDFPEVVTPATDIELANGAWNRIVLANSQTGLRATVYTIYEGSTFYALSFASGLDVDMNEEMASQEYIVEGFYWPSQFADDEYYDEDY